MGRIETSRHSRTKLSTASLGLDFISAARMHKECTSPPYLCQNRSAHIESLLSLGDSSSIPTCLDLSCGTPSLGIWVVALPDANSQPKPGLALKSTITYVGKVRISSHLDPTFLDTSLLSVCSPLSYQRINFKIFLALCRFLLGSPCGSANLEA